MNVVAVQPEDISDWMGPLDWHFLSFTRDGSLTPNLLWADVAQKERQLWVVTHENKVFAAILTRIAADQTKTCEVTHAAGEQREIWQHLWPALEYWAREIGCKRMVAVCRPGWERILREFGMKKTHVIVERAL